MHRKAIAPGLVAANAVRLAVVTTVSEARVTHEMHATVAEMSALHRAQIVILVIVRKPVATAVTSAEVISATVDAMTDLVTVAAPLPVATAVTSAEVISATTAVMIAPVTVAVPLQVAMVVTSAAVISATTDAMTAPVTVAVLLQVAMVVTSAVAIFATAAVMTVPVTVVAPPPVALAATSAVVMHVMRAATTAPVMVAVQALVLVWARVLRPPMCGVQMPPRAPCKLLQRRHKTCSSKKKARFASTSVCRTLVCARAAKAMPGLKTAGCW